MKDTWRAPWLAGALEAGYSATVMVMDWAKVLAGIDMVAPPADTVAGPEGLMTCEVDKIGPVAGVCVGV